MPPFKKVALAFYINKARNKYECTPVCYSFLTLFVVVSRLYRRTAKRCSEEKFSTVKQAVDLRIVENSIRFSTSHNNNNLIITYTTPECWPAGLAVTLVAAGAELWRARAAAVLQGGRPKA